MGEKFLLVVLADYCGFNTRECWPSHAQLAKDCMMSERSVIRAIASLERRGFITRLSRGNRGGPSRYRLNLDAPIGDSADASGDTGGIIQVTRETQTGDTDGTPPYNPPIRRTINEPVNNRLSERQLKRLRLMEQEKIRWEG